MALREILFNKDLFPTKWSLFIFIVYMSLFINQGLLVTASRKGDVTYPYNPTTVVLLTEVLKLIIALIVFLKDHSVSELREEFRSNSKVLGSYLIPAGLYCLYNNLSFTNLSYFDPTTYFILLQIRLIMTGIIYQFLFKRYLSITQWISLLLLTAGCMIQKMDLKEIGTRVISDGSLPAALPEVLNLSSGVIFILIQAGCSVFAGVYNEYLIKKSGSEVHIMMQNIFMYVDSIFCNVAVLSWKGELSSVLSKHNLASIWQLLVVAIVLNNSIAGIITSLFLKNLNSILKAFASALELVFTAILSFILLGIPIHGNTVVSVGVVSFAVIMYAKNPLKTTTSLSNNDDNDIPLVLPRDNDKIIVSHNIKQKSFSFGKISI